MLVSTVQPRKRSDKREDRSSVNEGRTGLDTGEGARTRDRSNWFLLRIGVWKRTKSGAGARSGSRRDLRGTGTGNPGRKGLRERGLGRTPEESQK